MWGSVYGLGVAALANYFIWYGAMRTGADFHVNAPMTMSIVLISALIGAAIAKTR